MRACLIFEPSISTAAAWRTGQTQFITDLSDVDFQKLGESQEQREGQGAHGGGPYAAQPVSASSA